MNGLVSIIMPSYNTAKFIEESIESVLKQTYQNWELIIVDDCSNDNTGEVVSMFNDSRIKYLVNERNSGAAVSRNKAMKEAKGRWIAFLDSDDLWLPEKLEKQLSYMIKNNLFFTYTKYIEINEFGQENGSLLSGPRRITKFGMLNYGYPGCLTVMYNADKVGLIQIGDVKKNNDYAIWLRAIKKADCFLLDEVLAKYRRRRGSISQASYWTLIKHTYYLYSISEQKGVITSVICTIRNCVFGVYKKAMYLKRNV